MSKYITIRTIPQYETEDVVLILPSDDPIKTGFYLMQNEIKAGKFTHIIKVTSQYPINMICQQVYAYMTTVHKLNYKSDLSDDINPLFYKSQCVKYLDNALYTVPSITISHLSQRDVDDINNNVRVKMNEYTKTRMDSIEKPCESFNFPTNI